MTYKLHLYRTFSLKLPENHILPFLLQKNPKYDKFLPHLARYINRTETIIDIGANIGDTLANMAEVNSEPEFICIEPHEDFYNLLIENINRVKQSLLDLRVESHNVLIGKNITNVKLEGHPGTKSATVTDKDGLKSLTLDSLIPADKKVKLIKCDIDGFDYDAIESGINTIEKNKPMLFFECYFKHSHQKLGYERLLIKLKSLGYYDWIIFDNFGEVILRINDIDVIKQLMSYIESQNNQKTTRTIYYFDILTVVKEDSKIVDLSLADFTPTQL